MIYAYNYDPRAFLGVVNKVLDFVLDVWGVMCSPFIDTISTPQGGMVTHQFPFYSYILVPVAIGCAFCAVALTKKLIIYLVGGGSSW